MGIEFSSDKNNLFHKTLGWKGRRMHHKKFWLGEKKKELRSKKQKENWQQTRKGPWKKKQVKLARESEKLKKEAHHSIKKRKKTKEKIR